MLFPLLLIEQLKFHFMFRIENKTYGNANFTVLADEKNEKYISIPRTGNFIVIRDVNEVVVKLNGNMFYNTSEATGTITINEQFQVEHRNY